MKQLFIVGVGRSGTSLLQSMLAAHKDIVMLPETGFLRRYAFSNVLCSSSLPSEDSRLQRIAPECWRDAYARIVVDEPLHSCLSVYASLISPDGLKCMRQSEGSVTSETEVAYVADKDPRLVEYLWLINAVFPDTHIVHIVRDPRDVLLSKGKAAWSRGRHWLVNLAIGRIHLDIARTAGLPLFGDRFHEIRYEDLIQNPEQTLTSLTNELGIPFEASMLSYSEAAQRLSGGQIEEWKRETLGPLLVQNSEKWRDGLSGTQLYVAQHAFRTLLAFHRYKNEARRSIFGILIENFFDVLSLVYRIYRTMRLKIWYRVYGKSEK